jgi:hypothetical protein
VRREGFGAYARRVAEPYRLAVEGHLTGGRATFTERGLRVVRRRVRGSARRHRERPPRPPG